MSKVFCPNEKCTHHLNPESKNFLKKGKIKGFKGRTYQRFQCKACGLKFSSRKLKWESGFKETDIIHDVFSRYTGGTTIQRISEDLSLDKKTVLKTVKFLGQKIADYHYSCLSRGMLRTKTVAFDEMESSVKSKNLPVSIGVAVCGESQKIIDIRVAEIRLRGKRKTKVERLHKLGKITLPPEYFTREDKSKEMCEKILSSVHHCIYNPASITTDEKKAYITLIRNILPSIQHFCIKSKSTKKMKKKTTRPYKKKLSPKVSDEGKLAFARLSSVEGVLRTYSSRLHRKTKITSKSLEMLQASLYMNLAYLNHYDLRDVLNFRK